MTARARSPAERPRHLVILASAGTGKTWHLSNRFLSLILKGVPVDQLLATTFTRKAAGEILQRVLFRLANAAVDEQQRAVLRDALELEELTRDQCLAALRQVTMHLHRVRVGTLDSFFMDIARSFSLELGLPTGWQILDAAEEIRLRDTAIDILLSQQQSHLVVHLMHLLTHGDAQRSVADLIRSTVTDLYGVYLQTPAEAWHRLPRRKELDDVELALVLDELRQAEVPDKRFAKTRDSDCERILAQEWNGLLKSGLAQKAIEDGTYYGKSLPPTLKQAYQKIVQHAVAVLCNQLVIRTEATYTLLDHFHHVYERLKKDRRGLRFDDVTRKLAGATRLTEAGQLAYRLDGAIENLLLDEFQDTSLEQWQVLRPFARRIADGNPRRSFFCVGDMKQAIYGWRGGNADLLSSLKDELPSICYDALNASFRSSAPVIELVNRVNQSLLRHPTLKRAHAGIEQWQKMFPDHQTRRNDLAGYVTLDSCPTDEDDRAMAAYTAQRVAEQIRRTPGASVGVLVRTNKHVGELIFELQSLGVAASEEGGNPLTDSAAVHLLLSLLRLADHPGDTAACFHVAHSPLAEHLQLVDAHCAQQAQRASAEIRRSLIDHGYGTCLHRWSQQLENVCNAREWRRLQQLVQLGFRYQQQAETPRQFGFSHQRRHSLRCDDFIHFVESQRVADPSSDAVRVMTVHQAKGLQFDVVMLPDLDYPLIGQPPSCVVHRPTATAPIDTVCRYVGQEVQSHLPQRFQEMFAAQAAHATREELCVLYVALTRAVHALHMIIKPSRPSEKSLPQTPGGLMRAALADRQPVPPESCLFTLGDPDWHKQHPEKFQVAGKSAVAALRPLPPERQPQPAPSGGRQSETTSPSELEGGGRIRVADRLDFSNSPALDYGTLIHAWMEQIQWLDGGPPDEATLRKVAERLEVRHLRVETALAEFRRMITRPTTAKLLSRSFYGDPAHSPLGRALAQEVGNERLRLQVRNEQPIAVCSEGSMLSGLVDRLVLVLDGAQPIAADIVDWKTDTLQADDRQAVRQRVSHYRPQIQAYRQAVSAMLRLPMQRVSARLLFVGCDLMCAVGPSARSAAD